MFAVGMEVECIDVSNKYGVARHQLSVGQVYTITGFWETSPNSPPYLYLAGVKGAWHPARFRPITKTATDISVFTKLLKTKEREVA